MYDWRATLATQPHIRQLQILQYLKANLSAKSNAYIRLMLRLITKCDMLF